MGSQPKCEFIRDQMLDLTGSLNVGPAIPPDRDLCRQFGVSRRTPRPPPQQEAAPPQQEADRWPANRSGLGGLAARRLGDGVTTMSHRGDAGDANLAALAPALRCGINRLRAPGPPRRSTMTLLIADAKVLTPDGPLSPGWLASEGRHITAVGRGDPPAEQLVGADLIDAAGATLGPGFVDVHVHGALGHETMDADPDRIRRMAEFYAGHGVTAFCPTTWTASAEHTRAAVDAVAEAMAAPGPGARILGVHLEGPYLNAERCGAQAPAHIRPADPSELTTLLDTGIVRLITLAPETEANRQAIGICRARGVTVSAGHTDATYEQVRSSIDLGVEHATHLFNAMSPLHHREPGAVGALLGDPRVRCEVIADDVHLHPGAVEVAWRAKGPQGLCLVTDALRATGSPAGTYRFGDRTVTHRDGAVWLENGALAGSVLTMDTALANFAAATGASLEEAWPVASRTPATAVGATDAGRLAVGARADLALLNDDLAVVATVVGGVPQRPPGRVAAPRSPRGG